MTRTFLPALFLALLAAPALAQAPTGPEFRVNTYTTGIQYVPFVDADSAGNFVVTWTSDQDQSGHGVYAQRYTVEGVPRGTEFRVNTSTTGLQQAPAASGIAMAPAGDFVIVWVDEFGDPDRAIMAQRFDASGAPRGANFRVNTFTTGIQFLPEVAIDDVGNFVIVWTGGGQDGDGYGVFGQRYDSGGTPRGAEFRVNTYTTYDQAIPSVTMKGNGDFVVVWYSGGQDGDGTGVFAQRFAASGNPQGGEFQVNTYTPFDQIGASISHDAAGNFVVAWTDAFQDGDVNGVFARRFDAAGVPLTGEFQVNTYTTWTQLFATVNMAPDGTFVVAWAGNGQDDGYGIFGRRYAPSGLPQGAEFRINSYTTAVQNFVAIGGDPSGNMVVSWTSFGQDGSMEGIYAQRFGLLVPEPPEVDPLGNRVFEPGETVGIAPAWRNVSGVTQAFTGVASNLTGPGAPTNPTYAILDGAADYGVVPNGATGTCTTTGNCYAFAVGIPSARPVLHWDATYHEDILPPSLGASLTRTLHLGDSFADVPRSSPFYRFAEIILHHDLTGGCGGGNFCPLQTTPREQMAVFVLVAKDRAGYQPPACVSGSEMFADVPASSPFCRWIEELSRRGIAGGCGGGNFCPLSPVTREQMSVFALATKEGTGYSPVACIAGLERFSDVPASSPFCRWIEELARRNVVGGCGGGNFCPIAPVTREQNAVFVSGTFGLTLY